MKDKEQSNNKINNKINDKTYLNDTDFGYYSLCTEEISSCDEK